MTETLVPRDPEQVALLRLDRAELPQYLTRDQVRKLIEKCRSTRDSLFVRVAFETGGRCSELLGICMHDLDLKNRQVRLVTLKRRAARQRKRRESFRWVPISDGLTADLANFLLAQKTPGLEPNAPSWPVQTTLTRLFPFTRQRAYEIVNSAGRRAGVVARGGRPVSPHILRHSFAMNLLTQGVPINVVQELLGHASVLNTMIYLKTDLAQAREFLSKVQF